MRSLLSFVLLLGTALLAFETQATGVANLDRSVSYEKIGTYDIQRLSNPLTTEYADFSTFEVTYPAPQNAVDLYRVSYPTVVPEKNNLPVRASGLIAVPQNLTAPAPVLSYQHGTVFSRYEVPSRPDDSMETRLAIACFAAHGYVVIAADYIGKGDSMQPDSYMTKASTAQACLDMLTAARKVLTELGVPTSGQLFLSG